MAKTTITVSPKVRAAYEAMRAETPGLTLSDFYEQAVSFWLRFADETTFKPMIRQMQALTSTVEQLSRHMDAQTRPPPPLHPERLAEIVAKQVIHYLTPVLTPPVTRSWWHRLLRRA